MSQTDPGGHSIDGAGACPCTQAHTARRIVLTGGPGAGKTAVLELVRRTLCRHVHILAESASIVFGGGFPRHDDPTCRQAAQLAIFHVQRQLEVVGGTHDAAIILCDRGTPDGLAYWPGPTEDFWAATGTSLEAEMARYDVVIHLRTPSSGQGYNQRNPLRTEPPVAAAEIDARIVEVWAAHPARQVVEAESHFVHKAATALALIRRELPACCAGQLPAVPGVPEDASAGD